MSHRTGYLSGVGPQENEKKTEAQKIDERRPAAMAAPRSMFDLAEMDDRPAIEQKTVNQDLIDNHGQNSKPQFEIDANFEKEIKAREAKERAERAKRQAEQSKQERATAKARQAAIAEKLEQSQTLDEEELREELSKAYFEANQQRLYPDAKPLQSDAEDELWRRRTDAGRQIAGRAKIEDTYNTALSHTIALSFIFQAIGVIIAAITFSANLKASAALIACLLCITIISASAVVLFKEGNKCQRHTIPSNQHTQFMLATAIPGMMVRLLFIELFLAIPITGQFVGCVIGTVIGASIHYTILNYYGVYISVSTTLVHLLLYAIVIIFELLCGSLSEGAFAIIFAIVYLGEFLFGDLTAMQLALLTDK